MPKDFEKLSKQFLWSVENQTDTWQENIKRNNPKLLLNRKPMNYVSQHGELIPEITMFNKNDISETWAWFSK